MHSLIKEGKKRKRKVPSDKIKVLHVVGGLNVGGIEKWLIQVLRHIDREKIQFDFMVHTTKKCFYDDIARELGARIIPNPYPKNPALYALNFIKLNKVYGPYDVVHSHTHHFSGFVIFLAWLCRIPKRIAHSHSDTRLAEEGKGVMRKAYLRLTESLIRSFATDGLAASVKAAESLFGYGWQADERWKILHCGIDIIPFLKSYDKERTKAELGLDGNAIVIGHVGRFENQKNHNFLLKIAKMIINDHSDYHFLFVGDGPLRNEVEKKARIDGLSANVHFLGIRGDIPRIMEAMDIFLFPSLYEGLGIVLIEAQASGLPCVVADNVPKEADVCGELIIRIGLERDLREWLEAIQKAVNISRKNRAMLKKEALVKLLESDFNIQTCVRELYDIYKR